METPETIRLSLKTEEWVISLDFSNAYFHIPIAPRSRKYLRFFLFHQTFQFTALPFGLATAPLEFTKIVKEVKLMAQARGIRIHQYLDDWLLRAPSPEICLQHTQTLLALCQQLGWVVNMNKSDLVPKQVFNFVGYLFNLITGRVLPTQDRWEALQKKLRFTKAHHQCTVRQLMSLIGLLTATEKQVSAGRLHMRPIQWHLKKNWQAYSGPSVTASSFRLVVRRGKCPNRSTLTPSSARSSTVYRRLKRRLGRSLRGLHCKRRLVSFRKSPSHKLSRTKGSPASSEAVRTSMQEQDCAGVNRQYDSCFVHKQARGYEVRLSLCSPLEASVLVPSQGHILSKLSRHNQVIQTEWSLSQQVFSQLCSKWTPPVVDLFATRFNHKLPSFVSPVPDQRAWAVDALSLSWEQLDAYAFPPVSLLPQVVSKLRDQGCLRMILVAPGWPNMPWFWDLVDLSVQIPFSLPLTRDLVTQPFNGLVHRNLQNLNLHAWLLEALPSGNTVSLKRWQHELRLLRGSQPEPCTSQSGPFL